MLDAGRWAPSSKLLVSNVTAVATALIAAKARVHVFSKGEVPRLYGELVADEWASFVSAVYVECRLEAAYRLPTEPAARARLQSLCDQAIVFENLLLDRSIPLLRDLEANDDPRRSAAATRRLATFTA